MTSKRVIYIDLCKTYGLFLVILGHGRLCPESWQQFIYSFHMPLFFILSGLLYNWKSFKDTLINDIKRLLIPYLIINLICFFCNIGVILLYDNLTFDIIASRIVGIFAVACYTGQYPPSSVPTWFIITLFLIRILLSFHNSKIYRILLVNVSVLTFIIMKRLNIDTWFPLDSALMSVPFFVLGIELTPLRDKKIVMNVRNVCMFFIAILFLTILNNYNGLVDIAWSSYGRSIGIFYLNGILGTSIILFCCKVLAPYIPHIFCQFCATISRGGVLVIGFNLFVIMLFQTIIEFCFGIINPVMGVVISVLILIVFYYMTLFCQKFFPLILGMK